MSATRSQTTKGSSPHGKKVGGVGLVTEERCTHKIVVKSGKGLPRIDITKLHER